LNNRDFDKFNKYDEAQGIAVFALMVAMAALILAGIAFFGG